MKKIVKAVLLILVAIAAVGGGIYYMNMPLKINLTEITPKDAEVYFIEQGSVTGDDNNVQVYALTGGKITQLNVAEDDEVKKGSIIAVIDYSDYEAQIFQADSSIKGYRAQIENLRLEEENKKDDMASGIKNLESELAALTAQEKTSQIQEKETYISKDEQIRLQNLIITQAEEDLIFAKDNLAKVEILYTQGAIPKSTYDESKKAVETYTGIVNQNKLQLEIIQKSSTVSNAEYYEAMKHGLNVQIDSLKESMSKDYTSAMTNYYEALIDGFRGNINLLNKKIEDSTIRATADGTIKNLEIKDRNVAIPQALICEIEQEQNTDITVYVSTKDVTDLKVSDIVGLTFSKRSGDVAFSGIIKEIGKEAEIKYSALGVEERKVKITIEPEVTDEFKPVKGYDVDVKFIIYSAKDKLLAPKTALYKENGRDKLWIVKDGIAASIEVVKGIETRTEVVIEQGLNISDLVVTEADTEGIKEGVKVDVSSFDK